MKNFLLISYYFPPAGGSQAAASIRLGKFAKYLPKYGWNPIIVSATDHNFSLSDTSILDTASMDVFRVRDPLPIFKGRFHITKYFPQPSDLLPWVIKASWTATRLAKQFDCKLIFASAPPVANFFLGAITNYFSHIPLVLDYRDQWTLSPYRIGPSMYKGWDKWFEGRVLRRSSLVFVTNTGRLNEHNTFWGTQSPRTINIPNGYDLSDFENIKIERQIIQDSFQSDKILLRHLGAIYGARMQTLNAFVLALEDYFKSTYLGKRLVLELVGNMGGIKFNNNSMTNFSVDVKRNVDHHTALKLEMNADILLLVIGQHSQSKAEISSKIFEYLASGRPVIVIGESDLLSSIAIDFQQVYLLGNDFSSSSLANLFLWINGINKNEYRDKTKEILKTKHFNLDREYIAKLVSEAFNDLMVGNERPC